MKRWWVALSLVVAVVALPVPADARVGHILDDRALIRTGKWKSKASTTSWEKTLSKSKDKGAKLTTPETTTGDGAVSFQAGPGRGKAQIIVGGVKKATVNTNAASKQTKVVQFTGAGAVVIKVKKPGKGVYVDVVALSNSGSGLPAPAAGEVIITEWLSQPTAHPSTAEWFELHNVASGARSLNGCTVTSQASNSVTFAALSISTSGEVLVARSSDPTENGGITPDAVFGYGLAASGSLTLKCGATTIDAVSWTGETEGQTTQLDPDHYTAADNDAPANFCLGTAPFGTDTDLGTPDALNTQCP